MPDTDEGPSTTDGAPGHFPPAPAPVQAPLEPRPARRRTARLQRAFAFLATGGGSMFERRRREPRVLDRTELHMICQALTEGRGGCIPRHLGEDLRHTLEFLHVERCTPSRPSSRPDAARVPESTANATAPSEQLRP